MFMVHYTVFSRDVPHATCKKLWRQTVAWWDNASDQCVPNALLTRAFQKERKARVLNVVFTGLHRAQCSRVEFWTLDYETLGS